MSSCVNGGFGGLGVDGWLWPEMEVGQGAVVLGCGERWHSGSALWVSTWLSLMVQGGGVTGAVVGSPGWRGCDGNGGVPLRKFFLCSCVVVG